MRYFMRGARITGFYAAVKGSAPNLLICGFVD